MNSGGTRFCVVLVRTQGPVNLGLVARACGNAGVDDLRLVAPECAVDCADARRFANHKRDFLLAAPVFASLDAAVADCGLVVGTSARARDEELGAPTDLAGLERLLVERPAERTALVFGNEAHGLDNRELARCQAFVHLETPGDYSSYNLSHSVAIVLHHLCAGSHAPQPPAVPEAAERVHVDRLEDYWLSTLAAFRYFRRTDRARFEPQFRQLLNRLHLSRRDIDTLYGMLAQMNYFTHGSKEPWALVNPDPPPQPQPPTSG